MRGREINVQTCIMVVKNNNNKVLNDKILQKIETLYNEITILMSGNIKVDGIIVNFVLYWCDLAVRDVIINFQVCIRGLWNDNRNILNTDIFNKVEILHEK